MPKITLLPAASSVDFGDNTNIVIVSENNFKTKRATIEQLKSNYFCDIYCASLTIATADVLTLNSTPLTIVPAVAGKKIIPIEASVDVDFNSVAYATNTTLELKHSGAALGIKRCNALASTISNGMNFDVNVAPTALNTQLLVNADLVVTVATGNPTAGDSDITVYVLYRLI